MLLYPGRLTPAIEELTRRILYILWDTGLDIGFSIRSVDETIALGGGDLNTLTSLLDRRFIYGNRALFDVLKERIKRDLLSERRLKNFIKSKLEENTLRHQKYGDSVYILEPNIKEGEGGLRDIHTAMWIVKARGTNGHDPVSLGLLSEDDRDSLTRAVDFLFWVRNELHFETGRKTDQLSFDHQERIAELLNYTDTEHFLAVELFMQQYYRYASDINHFSNLILSRSLNEGRKRRFFSRKRPVDDDFFIQDGLLSLRDRDLLRRDPHAILRAFEHFQSHGVGLSQSLKDSILDNLERVDKGFIESRDCAESFLRILRGRDVFRTLSEMHRLKFLERYIPEFGEITHRVQHDLYHIYTVDIHSLFSVRELERLRGEYREEFRLLSTIFDEVRKPEVLFLGVLLHDIGKARGKGHAQKGGEMAREIGRRLHLPEEDIELLSFLVTNHLLLADTAQYRDLHDEKLIVEFARKVGEIERLDLLYLLTFADIRAVGPEVWNQWKGALFQEIYFKALRVLERRTFEIEEAGPRIERIRKEVRDILREQGQYMDDVEEYFQLLPQRYFLSNSPEFIAEHIKVVRELKVRERPYIMKVRQDRDREYTEIIICTFDIHGLFSRITGVMAANSVDILGAQINTLRNGIALDILQVTTPFGDLIEDEWRLEKIEDDFSKVLSGRVRVEDLVGRKKPSILDMKKKPKVATRIHVDNSVSDHCTVLDIHAQNRIGLLYTITSVLSRLGVYIYVAKITTKGDEAADIFYVRDIFGQKIYNEEKLKRIVDSLYRAMDDGSQDSLREHNRAV